MIATTIILTASITALIFSIGINLVLWFRRCKNCGEDKEIGNIFKSVCHRCNKKNGKTKKEKIDIL